MSLHPNAVLPCPSDSARRRHAAHGQTCRVCERATPTDQITLARLLKDNQRMADRLAEADRALKTLLQYPVIRHEAVDRAHRRLFPATNPEGAAA